MIATDPEVRRFVQRICQRERQLPDVERRAHSRYQTILSVFVTPCDVEDTRMADQFRAVTKDFSAGGLAILHTRPIESPRMLVQIHHGTESMTLKARVVRCRAIGVFYEIGGEFLERVDDTIDASPAFSS